MKNLKKFLLILAFAAAAAVFADKNSTDTITLSLEDVLFRAIENSPLIAVERIKTDVAQTVVREHIYAYEPTLRASYHTYNRDRFFDSGQTQIGINQISPVGTSIEAGFNFNHFDTSRTDVSAPRTTTANLKITQALLQGLPPRVNLVPIRKAKLDVEITREELSAYTQRLLAEAERAYWDLVLSKEEVVIYEYSLNLADRMLYEAQERLNTGSIAPIDLAAIRAEVASRKRQLFDAQVAKSQKTLYLVYLINAPQYFEKTLSLSDSATTLGDIDDVELHLQAANRFRQDLRQARALAQKGELDIIQTKNGIFPRLDFFMDLQTDAFPSNTFTFSDALVSVGLRLQFPASQGAARQRYRRAVYTHEQQNLALENFSRLIEYEIRSAHIDVLRAARQIETARTLSELEKQKLDAEQERMNVGRSTGYAVLQVQRDLVSAHLDEARAKTAYVNALLTLYSRDATLLQRRGVGE